MIQPNNLLLTASRVEISATGKTPTVNILAYSGGLMHVPGWGHLVIDLSGLDLSSSQIGILSDHDSTLKGIVGHGQAEIRNGKLLVAGTIAEATDAARQIISLAKSGFQFQASVGVSPTKTERVESHQKVEVNGRLIKSDNNGFLLVRSGLLREVSIVAIGADPGTAVSISASLKKENQSMADDTATLTADEIRSQAAEGGIFTGPSIVGSGIPAWNFVRKLHIGKDLRSSAMP